WRTSADNLPTLLGEYRDALGRGDFVNPSKLALEECRSYVFSPKGVEHAIVQNSLDLSGASKRHGDRVIADSLCWLGMKDRQKQPAPVEPEEIPMESLAWRR